MKYINLIIAFLLIGYILSSCSVRLYTKKRPIMDSANVFIDTAVYYFNYSQSVRAYNLIKKDDNFINLNNEQIEQLNKILLKSTPWYLIAYIPGGDVDVFLQTYSKGKEQGMRFYSYPIGNDKSGAIIDLSNRRMYVINDENDLWFLYELTKLSQKKSTFWLNMQEQINEKYNR